MIFSQNAAALHLRTILLAKFAAFRHVPRVMSELPTADLLSLDTDGLRSRLSKLRRYL